MQQLTGFRVLTASVLIWAFAVWIFGDPPKEPIHEEGALESDIAIADPSIAEPSLHEPSAGGFEDSRTPDPVSVSKPDPEPSAEASSESMSAPSSSGRTTAPFVSSAKAPEDAASIPPSIPRPIPPPLSSAPEHFGKTPGGLHVDPPEAGDVGDRLAPGDFDPPPIQRPRSSPPPPEMPRADISRAHPVWPPSWPQWPRPPSALAMDFDLSIEAARKAAWEGRLSDALAHYRSAANIDPESHVAWGEMGNVLWQMQRWPQAAYALEGAAVLLVDEGEFRAALELMFAVESIDQDAAYRIRYHLWAVFSEWAGPRPEPVPHWNH